MDLNGPVEQRIRVVRILGNSTFTQDYVLHCNSSIIRIESEVDWRDRHIVVKAAFPFTLTSDHATYDMPFGAIQRSTNPQTPTEKAKWEVPGLAWADLTEEANPSSDAAPYGVSILSDYKHGYSATQSELRLTLLRGPTWPDPESDQGHHTFVYALYPHIDSWQTVHTVHRSYELRHPLQAQLLPIQTAAQASSDPQGAREEGDHTWMHHGSFLSMPGEHFIVSAVKQSESSTNTWIVRGYECHGQMGALDDNLTQINSESIANIPLNLLDIAQDAEETSLLEIPMINRAKASEQSVSLRPWGIHTWSITR